MSDTVAKEPAEGAIESSKDCNGVNIKDKYHAQEKRGETFGGNSLDNEKNTHNAEDEKRIESSDCSSLGKHLLTERIFTYCCDCANGFHKGFTYKKVPRSQLEWICVNFEKCDASIRIVWPAFLEIGRHTCQINTQGDKKNHKSLQKIDPIIAVFEEYCKFTQCKKKYLLTRYTKVNVVYCLDFDKQKNDSGDVASTETTDFANVPVIYSYIKCFKNMINYLGYEYEPDSPHKHKVLGQYKCANKNLECPALIMIFKDMAALRINEHTCDQASILTFAGDQNAAEKELVNCVNCYADLYHYKGSFTPVQGISIIYGIESDSSYFPEIDPSDFTTLVYYWNTEENEVNFISYMGNIFEYRTHNKLWKCITGKSCPATLRIMRNVKGILRIGKHNHCCDKGNYIEDAVDIISTSDEIELLNSQDGVSLKDENTCEPVDDIDKYFKEISVEMNEMADHNKKYYALDRDNIISEKSNCVIHEIVETSQLEENNQITSKSAVNIQDCQSSIVCNSVVTAQTNFVSTDPKTHQESNTLECESTAIKPVISSNTDFNKCNNDTKGLVTVNIINHSIKDVSLNDQKNYEVILNSDHYSNSYLPQVLFMGYRFFKGRRRSATESVTCTCINKHNLNCPGLITMLPDKVMEFMEHTCKGQKHEKNLSQLDADDDKNIRLYWNTSISEEEALYNGYTYRRYIKDYYCVLYNCIEKSIGCNATIKLFPRTNLLRHIGKHIHPHFPNNPRDLFVNKDDSQDKSLIFVFEHETEPFIGYKSFLYHKIMTNTIWSCIEKQKTGCEGLLHMESGLVTSVSPHTTCLRTRNSGENLFLFRDTRTEEKYAMHLGCIYKTCKNYSKDQMICLWNCLGGTVKKCPGTMTTKENKVMTVSSHECRIIKENIGNDNDTCTKNTTGYVQSKHCDDVLEKTEEQRGLNSNRLVTDPFAQNAGRSIPEMKTVFSTSQNIDNTEEESQIKNTVSAKQSTLPKINPTLVYQGDKPFLIHRGFLYAPEYNEISQIRWMCINFQRTGCNGELHLNSQGRVRSVSKHSCLIRCYDNEYLFLFHCKLSMDRYAMYRGYIYKKGYAINRDRSIYKWICFGSRTEECDGYISIKNNNQVVALLAHVSRCLEEVQEGSEFKVYFDPLVSIKEGGGILTEEYDNSDIVTHLVPKEIKAEANEIVEKVTSNITTGYNGLNQQEHNAGFEMNDCVILVKEENDYNVYFDPCSSLKQENCIFIGSIQNPSMSSQNLIYSQQNVCDEMEVLKPLELNSGISYSITSDNQDTTSNIAVYCTNSNNVNSLDNTIGADNDGNVDASKSCKKIAKKGRALRGKVPRRPRNKNNSQKSEQSKISESAACEVSVTSSAINLRGSEQSISFSETTVEKRGKKRNAPIIEIYRPQKIKNDIDINGLQKVNILKFVHKNVLTVQENSRTFPLDQHVTYQPEVEFRGYVHLRIQDCILLPKTDKYSCENIYCLGSITLENDKIVEYMEHTCKDLANQTLDKVDLNAYTVFLYRNRFTGAREAACKNFAYGLTADKKYYTVWECTRMDLGCSALMKLFPLTSLFREMGTHICKVSETKKEHLNETTNGGEAEIKTTEKPSFKEEPVTHAQEEFFKDEPNFNESSVKVFTELVPNDEISVRESHSKKENEAECDELLETV